MTFNRTNLAFAILLGGLTFFVSSSAEAGFIVTNLDRDVMHTKPTSDSGSAGSFDTPGLPGRSPKRVEFDRFGLCPNGASGGMTSQTSSGPGSGPPLAILAEEIDASVLLMAWLGPEGRVWLPPPLSTGVFRPPRYPG